ncbi:MAG: TIGR00300 family protein [Actinobacteria bacterium HGW-Actinobacteria-6]|nr:MAG: TIGR00300 family protein [Actinobacteria bacterium HGW-Actinobacteria-6]
MPHRPYEDVRVEGHLIDSGIMSQIMDTIVALDGEFETLSFEVGRTNEDASVAEMRVKGRDQEHLEELLGSVQLFGVVPLHPDDAVLAPVPCDGVFPEGFYSTTNLETAVRIGGLWVRVENPEMDLGIRVDPTTGTAETIPMADTREGELFVVGHGGLRVQPIERPRAGQAFEFMNSAVSSEKPKAQVVAEIARMLREVRAAGKEVIAVVGPAVVHTGAAGHLARLVEMGYVSVLFGGNAVATHDIESAIYGTSLGVSISEGIPKVGGHEHHLRAINTIRRVGGIRQAVEQGVLTEGLMYTLVKTGTPYVLAGSIRDDGPLPDVITDAVDAQRAMRPYCRTAGACIMLSTMLHSIATGNMLPAAVTTVCVDINPAVVTKLSDRGSFQTIGIVTDVGLFLGQVADDLASTYHPE